jgi:hypothetical protein
MISGEKERLRYESRGYDEDESTMDLDQTELDDETIMAVAAKDTITIEGDAKTGRPRQTVRFTRGDRVIVRRVRSIPLMQERNTLLLQLEHNKQSWPVGNMSADQARLYLSWCLPKFYVDPRKSAGKTSLAGATVLESMKSCADVRCDWYRIQTISSSS